MKTLFKLASTALCAISLTAPNLSYADNSPERVIYQLVCNGDNDTVVNGTQYIFTVTNKTLTTEFNGFNGHHTVKQETITHINAELNKKGNLYALGVATKDFLPPEKKPDGYVNYYRSYTFFSTWVQKSNAVLRMNPKTQQLDKTNPIWGVDKLKFKNCKITKGMSTQDMHKYR